MAAHLLQESCRGEIALPIKLHAHLGVISGDVVDVQEIEGGLLLVPFAPEVNRQLRVAWRIMDVDAEALRRLADS